MLFPKDVIDKLVKQEFQNKNNLIKRLIKERPYPIKINLKLPSEKNQLLELTTYTKFLNEWNEFKFQHLVRRKNASYKVMKNENIPYEFVINNDKELLECLPTSCGNEILKLVKRAIDLSKVFNNASYNEYYKLLKEIQKLSDTDFEKVLQILPQLKRNMGQGKTYLRALPLVGVDTKFLEINEVVILIIEVLKVAKILTSSDLELLDNKNTLDVIDNINDMEQTVPISLNITTTSANATNIEKVNNNLENNDTSNITTEKNTTVNISQANNILYNFLNVLHKPKGFINIRILDNNLYEYFYGLSTFKITQEELANINLPSVNILVVENEQSGYMLPNLKNTIAIFGCGNNLAWSRANWLKEKKKIYYWGDLDSWGFRMLANFRMNVGFEKVKSIFMDLTTIQKHEFAAVTEESSITTIDLNFLTSSEQEALDYLRTHTLNRIEQEKLIGDYVYNNLLLAFSEQDITK